MMMQDNRAGTWSSSKAKQKAIPPFQPLKATRKFERANPWNTALRLFNALIDCVDNKTRRMKELKSISYFAEKFGCAPRTVSAALADLVARGWVRVIHRRSPDGKWLINDYEMWADIAPGRPWEYKERRRKCARKKPPNVRHYFGPDVEVVYDENELAAESSEFAELAEFAGLVELAAEPVELAAEPVELAAEPVELAAEPVELAAEPVELAAEPVELAAEPVELAAEPVELAAEPVELAAEPVGKSVHVDLDKVFAFVRAERRKLMDEMDRDPGHPDDPPREKRHEVSQSFVEIAERVRRRHLSQAQGKPLHFVVRVMLTEWLGWRGSDRHPSYLIDRGHSLFCLPGDMARLRAWFSRKYLERRPRPPPPTQEERPKPRVRLETSFSDEDRSALEALKRVLKPPLGEAAPNPGEKTAMPELFVRPACEYPTSTGVCGAHAVEMLEVAEKVYRATCQAHQHALWYLPNEPPSPAGGDGSDE